MAVDQRREAMRNDHHRPTVRHALKISIYQRFALRIERRGRLVEDQQLGIGDQGTGNGETLTLTAGEVRRAFLNPGFISLRQPFDKLFGAGEPGRAHGVLEAEARASCKDIVPYRAAKQEVLLQHDAEALAQMT